jgi:hypothetical protein
MGGLVNARARRCLIFCKGFALLGDLLSLCLPKEKVSKEKWHPSITADGKKRHRYPALLEAERALRNSPAAQTVLALKLSRTASVMLGVVEGALVPAQNIVLIRWTMLDPKHLRV